MKAEHLITLGVVLATVGGAMVWASGAPDRRRRRSTRRPGAFMCATAIGGFVTGLQWVLLSSTSSITAAGPVWAAVLGLPAFLAGATLVRVALAVCAAVGRYRRRDQHARFGGGRR